MSAINFPNNPSINDEFTQGEKVWRWNGFRWRAIPASLINVRQQIAQANAAREAVEQTLTNAEQTISGLSNGMDGKATTVTFAGTILAADTWTDYSGIFTLSKTGGTLTGLLSTDNPVVDLELSTIADPVTNVPLVQIAWSLIYRIEITDDSVEYYATAEPVFPEDTDIQFKVVR